GFNPLLIGLGLIPATSSPHGPQLADYFCSQAVAYGNSREQAEGLLEAYRSAMWFMVHSGYSPIMAHPDTYEHVCFWSCEAQARQRTASRSVLPGSKPRRSNSRLAEPVLAAGEQTLSIAPARQYKRVEEIIQLLTSALGSTKNSELGTATFIA